MTSDHMGFVAIGFGISIGFVSFLFALGINYKPEYDLLIYSLFGFGIMVAISMGFVVWHYEKKQEELKQEIENLRKEYI